MIRSVDVLKRRLGGHRGVCVSECVGGGGGSYIGPCKSYFSFVFDKGTVVVRTISLGRVAIFNWGLTDLVLLCFRVVLWKSYLSCI